MTSYLGRTVIFRFARVNVCRAVEPLVTTVAPLGRGRQIRLAFVGLAIANLGICLRFRAGSVLSLVRWAIGLRCLSSACAVIGQTLKADNRMVCRPELRTCFR